MSELLSLREFLDWPWEPTEKIVDPWLPTSGISMIYAGRGAGKTFVTLAMMLHVATGWRFLDMDVPKPRRVLYVDGEMSADEVKTRLLKLEVGMGPFPSWTYSNLAILSHERFEKGIPDLSAAGRGRRLIEGFVKEHQPELIVIDNLSCLVQTGSENVAEDRANFMSWLLNFRRQHIASLFLQHAGKPNQAGQTSQRGTSKIEDVLNSSIKLTCLQKAPILRIEWLIDKVRSFTPDPEKFDLEVRFERKGGREVAARVQLAETIDGEVAEVMALQAAEGLSIRQVADRLGKSKSKVGRLLKRSRVPS